MSPTGRTASPAFPSRHSSACPSRRPATYVHSFFGLEYDPIHGIIFLYYVILGLALVTNLVTLRLRRLPIGRAWEAMREDEIACRSLGINTTITKLTAFAIGAMFGGLGGRLLRHAAGLHQPGIFTFIESAIILAIVVLGGMGSQIGVVIAAIVMIGGFELLRKTEGSKAVFGEDFDPALYRMLLFGSAMVGIMLWRPRGIISSRKPSIALKSGAAMSRDLVKEGQRMRRVADRPLLKVEHLTMRFGGLIAVDNVSFDVADRHHRADRARTARARPQCSTASPASTNRPRERCSSIIRLGPSSGWNGSTTTTSTPRLASPAPSRISGCSAA